MPPARLAAAAAAAALLAACTPSSPGRPGSLEQERAAYAWAESDDSPFGLGATVTLTDRLEPREALDRIGTVERALGVTGVREAREWASEAPPTEQRSALEAGREGDWTLLVELLGSRGNAEDSVEALTRDGGTAVSLYGGGAMYQVQVARAGRVVRSFDALLPDQGFEGPPLPEEAGLVFGEVEPSPLVSALVLVERLTGVRLQLEDVLEPSGRVAVGLSTDLSAPPS